MIIRKILTAAAKRVLALAFAAALAVAPALADQSYLGAPTTGTLPGLTMVNDYNSALNAINTCNSGASAPSNQMAGAPSPGNCWYSPSTGALAYYDGTSWLTVGYLDATNHVWTPALGGNAATSVASAATTNLCGASGAAPQGAYLTVTGVVAITSFGSNCAGGQLKIVTFAAALQLTYNASSLILPGGGNVTTAAGDAAIFVYLGAGNWKAVFYQAASGTPLVAFSFVAPPSGRLTLVSATPYMTPSVATIGVATVFYTPTPSGNQMPVWNGSAFAPGPFIETSQALNDTTRSPAAAIANAVYDEFECPISGVPTITRGPAWSTPTTRSLGLARGPSGIFTNASNILNGSSAVSCAAGYGVWVGTIATDAGAATVSFNPTPAAASGGPSGGAWVGLWNAFNRVSVSAREQDNNTSWTYSGAAWRQSDNSANNRITNVVGQVQDSISVEFVQGQLGAQGSQSMVGIGVNSASTPSGVVGITPNTSNSGVASEGSPTARFDGLPSLGLSFYQALEWSNNTSSTFYGGSTPSGGSGQAHQLSAQVTY